MTYRIGVDVGGTFTDVLLVDEQSGAIWRAKTTSTPNDLSLGVLHGIGKVCESAGVPRDKITQVLHGTTVATNAILEGKGAVVGLVTTEGFRQVLQIARSFVPGGLAGWIIWPKPEPLADLRNTVEVRGRIASDGTVVADLDIDQARSALRSLRGKGIQALAISFINAFSNDEHEKAVARLASEELPGISVSLSSRVLPEMREYERTITTVANSYVQPKVAGYVDDLSTKLKGVGLGGSLSILRSDGGLATAEFAAEHPVTVLMSGPAGGVRGAVWVAEQCGFHDLLTYDMGGTSTDVALVQKLVPRIGRETKVGDLTVRASSVDVRTVGAGGGSIAHVPALTKALRVGPRSAGAVPGPAAYGKGGTDPTVTDANLVLGYLPTSLAGGEIELDVNGARKAVQKVADAMGLPSAEAAAAGIVDIVNENMLGALRLVSVQQGFDPRDFALVAFGGAGPMHANALGRLTGAWPVIVPPSPGLLCALGDATTSARDEVARTCLRRFRDLTGQDFKVILRELSATASASLVAQGIAAGDQIAGYQVDVRYFGQGFEVPIDVDPRWLDDVDTVLASLAAAFDAEHKRLFSFLLSADHELVNARAFVAGPRPMVTPIQLRPGDGDASGAKTGTTRIYVDGAFAEAVVYARDRLDAGDIIRGPAIVTEMDSTTLVQPGYQATTHQSGSLLIYPTEI